MIFKNTVPDESDEERRELERMVAEAAAGKSRRNKDPRSHHGVKPAKTEDTSTPTSEYPPEKATFTPEKGPAT